MTIQGMVGKSVSRFEIGHSQEILSYHWLVGILVQNWTTQFMGGQVCQTIRKRTIDRVGKGVSNLSKRTLSHFAYVVNFTKVVTAVFEIITSISVVKSSFGGLFRWMEKSNSHAWYSVLKDFILLWFFCDHFKIDHIIRWLNK